MSANNLSNSTESSDSDSNSFESNLTKSNNKNLIGEILNNKYLLITPIGSGTFSTVWLSLNLKTNQYYAMKIQNVDCYENGIDEINICKNLSTDNCQYINKMIEHFEYININGSSDDVHICMVFDICAGSLYDIMRIGIYSKGFSLDIVKKIIKQLLIAIDILTTKHKILHSDIKPENILVVGINNRIQEMIKLTENNKYLINYLKNNKQKKSNNLNKNLKEEIKKISFDSINIKYGNKSALENTVFIDDKYINNIIIKLADFGNCRKTNYSDFDIQTLYYRAPEMILQYKYNKNCDIWSVGCVIFELLTGKLLFNPDKTIRFSRKRHHLRDIISLLGKIPDNILITSIQKHEFFKTNGLLKGTYNVNYVSLKTLITNEVTNLKGFNDEEIKTLIELMYKLLDYDSFRRPDAKTILNSNWLK